MVFLDFVGWEKVTMVSMIHTVVTVLVVAHSAYVLTYHPRRFRSRGKKSQCHQP